MLIIDAATVLGIATIPRLLTCLSEAFQGRHVIPPRQVVRVPGGTGDRWFVSMPAFDFTGAGMIKLVTVFPQTKASQLATAQATIIVFSSEGTPIAILDGTAVTHRRTGAASALASKYLSRQDSAHLVLIGTGALAPTMAAAHCVVRPISRVSVWGRRTEVAQTTVAAIRKLVGPRVRIGVATELEAAVRTADIVCCATSSPSPVLAGKWLRRGTFVDLVGSFSPSTRESDDDVVRGARIFVDTFDGALSEAGDILDPLARGVITRDRIEGELADLVRGSVMGRQDQNEITLFKSVGTAIEDLAAALMILSAVGGSGLLGIQPVPDSIP